MEDEQVIADTSALISFAAADRIDLILGAFEEIALAPGVLRELSARLSRWPPLSQILALRRPFREIRLPPEASSLAEQWHSEKLGCGEAESIAVALHKKMTVLMDDRAARDFAESLKVRVIGTLHVLKRCKERRLIPEAKPILDRMCSDGRFFRPRLVDAFLRSIGER